jgi:hypothetical protein
MGSALADQDRSAVYGWTVGQRQCSLSSSPCCVLLLPDPTSPNKRLPHFRSLSHPLQPCPQPPSVRCQYLQRWHHHTCHHPLHWTCRALPGGGGGGGGRGGGVLRGCLAARHDIDMYITGWAPRGPAAPSTGIPMTYKMLAQMLGGRGPPGLPVGQMGQNNIRFGGLRRTSSRQGALKKKN